MREHYSNKIFDVIKVDTTEQDGDPHTKNLSEDNYNKHSNNFRNGTPFVYQNWDDLILEISNKDWILGQREDVDGSQKSAQLFKNNKEKEIQSRSG